jgi:tRNA(fMet)-specific endonuclease VapC
LAVLIDTDLLIEWERSEDAAGLERIVAEEDRAISVITASELLHGVARSADAHRARRRAFVEHVLAALDPVPIAEPVARVHAEIWSDLEQRGAMIGAHDLWIAASALAHGFGVATRNARDFGRVPGLRIVSP